MGRDLMPMFKEACDGEYPDNIYFSEEWLNLVYCMYDSKKPVGF